MVASVFAFADVVVVAAAAEAGLGVAFGLRDFFSPGDGDASAAVAAGAGVAKAFRGADSSVNPDVWIFRIWSFGHRVVVANLFSKVVAG